MAKKIILNLQQLRAQKAVRRSVIIDFNGDEHEIKKIELDGILEIMEIEQQFEAMREQEAEGTVDNAREIEMLVKLRDLVAVVLPTFPVGGLQLDELMLIAQALQASVQPDNDADDEDGDGLGE